MPIYEYQCDQCSHQFDAIQKFSDAVLELCPECDHKALRKKISAPSFRLSGSGWYETDFKSDKEKKRNLAGDRQEPSAGGEPSANKEPSANREPSKSKAVSGSASNGNKSTNQISKPAATASNS